MLRRKKNCRFGFVYRLNIYLMSSTNNQSTALSILGGGPAGLAAAFYARKRDIPFVVYEAGPRIGGNCRTLEHNGFRFDTGAHRFHARYPDITADMLELMGNDLVKIDVPSQIVYGKRFIDFPLSPLNLITRLGPRKVTAAAIDFVRARRNGNGFDNFKDSAVGTYGQTIADAFLLGYSEKLWGLPAARLSPAISGKRLKGLNVSTFLKEVFKGRRQKTEHLDGSFFYPRLGIGMLMDRIGEYCGAENLRTNSPVTQVFHSGNRVTELEIAGSRVPAESVVSTLPLNVLVQSLQPAAPQRLIELAQKIRFQNLVLVVLLLKRDRVSGNASFYFPDPSTPFTRACEPKNRSNAMSPAGMTSLAMELPCGADSSCWKEPDDRLIETAAHYATSVGLMDRGDLLEGVVYRMRNAYPILEVGHEAVVAEIMSYLSQFENLFISGRNGKFSYLHVHDLLREGNELTARLENNSQSAVGAKVADEVAKL